MKLSYGPGLKVIWTMMQYSQLSSTSECPHKTGPSFAKYFAVLPPSNFENVILRKILDTLVQRCKKKKKNLCPKSFARDCTRTALVYRSFYIHPLSQGWTTDRLD